MSTIRITHGTATVELDAPLDARQATGAFPRYLPRDLCDATCAALLAVNTPEAVAWAHALYRATGDITPRHTDTEET